MTNLENYLLFLGIVGLFALMAYYVYRMDTRRPK